MNNKYKVNDLVLADNLSFQSVIGCIVSINHDAEWGYNIIWCDGVETNERETTVDRYAERFRERMKQND